MKQILSTITALLVMVMIGHTQANRRLSNLLSPTAVNTHLLPVSSGTIDLGSDAFRWRNGYFNGSVTAYGVGGSYGVYGTGTSYGVRGISSSGSGVYGSSTSSYGVRGTSSSESGVRGESTDFYGVTGSSTNAVGVRGAGGPTGVYGTGTSNGVRGVSTDGYGVNGSSTNFYGVTGSSTNSYGVRGAGGTRGVYGTGTSYGVVGEGGTYGVYGNGTSYGVRGISTDGWGVYGSSTSDYGGNFHSTNSYGIRASSTNNFYAGYFDGAVYSTEGYYTSDKNLKKNIQDFGDAMSIINKLKPKNFEFRNDGKYASLNLPKGTHYGLMAQDLEQVLPNLVKESAHEIRSIDKPENEPEAKNPLAADSKETIVREEQKETQQKEKPETINIKAVNYTELIPLLIKGMQEQQAQIDELKSQLASVKGNTGSDAADLTGAWLKQNSPNPFRENTTVQFALPAPVKDAQLLIYDQGGRLVKSVSVSSGQNQVSFTKGSLPSGNYVYTLMVNGKKVDSKNMIIAK